LSPPGGASIESYFRYFSEIEECFRRCRGTPFLLSTLDWALIEAWKEADVPLEAVLSGIEHSFEKFARKPSRFRKINGLAYCSQEVLRAAEAIRAAETQDGATPKVHEDPEPPFRREEILKYFGRNRAALEVAALKARDSGQKVLADDLDDAAQSLASLATARATGASDDFEALERQLTALEEKVSAALMRASSTNSLAQLREEVDRGLRIDRRKMTVAQIESLERQYLKKRLFEQYGVPRMSLFYL
jgi:hypothetical protein